MKKRIVTLLTALALAASIAGCAASETSIKNTAPETGTETATVTVEETDTAGETETPEKEKEEKTGFSLSQVPDYDGKHPYVEINGNTPYFTKDELKQDTFETYADLDALGRCGVAYAKIGKELMPTEERGEIGQVRPSGWHTAKYNGCVEGNYLYNRCHLIGFQLAGENANEKNLITGTRYLNVDGMLPFENMVADYVKETGNHVLYRVTPVFDGDNLVASGVLMEACSVEDNGDGVYFNVYCYNVQPGIIIDYATGESALDENFTGEYATDNAFSGGDDKKDSHYTAEGQGEEKEVKKETTYVVNTNTGKFHRPDCSSVTDMASHNMEETTKSREELIDEGYSPCGRCNP